MFEIMYFMIGFIVGAVIIYFFMNRQQKTARELAEELTRTTQEEKLRELDRMMNRLKESFGALSMESLSKSTGEFLKLANKSFTDQSKMGEQQLDSKKQLIDETLKNMKSELEKVQEVVKKVENERKESFGQLSAQIKNSAEQTRQLQDTTKQLNAALSSTQIRGQWGERMAEDVLRLAGFIEGVNYLKQKTLTGGTTRPDFTFLLPKDLKVNMDVKFPLNNYLAYLNADNDTERASLKNQFIKDVRTRIKEVTGRDYINPAENTVDYVIVFIPNEQVYAFINENDAGLMDEALRNKVILSSPVTLYAVLAIIRQAIDNFNLEKTAAEILSLLGEFNKQWNNFKAGMDKMGNRLDDAQKEFHKLITTRTNQLERPLIKIDAIRSDNRLQAPEEDT
ncbi:MAG: DNA recombination protein RmuC [Calditrichaceae bacterium]|jgi:DNA recombination protein RmuC